MEEAQRGAVAGGRGHAVVGSLHLGGRVPLGRAQDDAAPRTEPREPATNAWVARSLAVALQLHEAVEDGRHHVLRLRSIDGARACVVRRHAQLVRARRHIRDRGLLRVATARPPLRIGSAQHVEDLSDARVELFERVEHDVEAATLLHEFGRLELARARFVVRLLVGFEHRVQDDVWASKADASLGDANLHVRLHRVRRGDATIRWVFQHGDER